MQVVMHEGTKAGCQGNHSPSMKAHPLLSQHPVSEFLWHCQQSIQTSWLYIRGAALDTLLTVPLQSSWMTRSHLLSIFISA